MSTEIRTPFAPSMRTRTCAAQLFGSWMIEPKFFGQAIEAVRSGKLKPKVTDDDDEDAGEEKKKPLTIAELDEDYADDEECGYTIKNINGVSIAIICIEGTMLKYRSSFGGCSTVELRRAVRAASNDRMVQAIMLYIDSPGGSCAGTSDLANDVAKAATGKPLYTFFANMGASAAYWAGSQADRIWANEIAMVGSIGTYCVLEDDTKLNDEIGIKLTVVSTGPFKGLGADGKVTDLLISDVQREIDDLNERFLVAVAAGRGMDMEKVRALADGRVHVGEKAVQEGLVDVVGTFDAAMQALSQEKPKMGQSITREQFDSYAAEHPDAVEPFVKQGHQKGLSEGRSTGMLAAAAILTVFGLADHAATASIKAGDDEATAKRIADTQAKTRIEVEATARAKDTEAENLRKENEKLKAQIGTQGAVGVAGSVKAGEQQQQAAVPGGAQGSAKDRFNAKVAETEKTLGLTKQMAIAKVVKDDPKLHQEYLDEVNASRQTQQQK